jgi:hypothetical protein
LAIRLFRMTDRISNEENFCIHEASDGQFKTKSCSPLSCVLLVFVSSYLQSLVRYTFLILGTNLPDIVYLRDLECEDPWLIFEAKTNPRVKKILRNTNIDCFLL